MKGLDGGGFRKINPFMEIRFSPKRELDMKTIPLAMVFAYTLFSVSGNAAAFLSANPAYNINSQLQETGSQPKTLDAYYSELEMDFTSFDPDDSSGQPLILTHSEQRMKFARLPEWKPTAPDFPKDGLTDRVEITFERLVNTSRVRVPGLQQPFETKSDLGALLRTRPLLIRGDGKSSKKIENLEKVRAEILSEVRDPVSRTAVMALLNEGILLKIGASTGEGMSCLGSFQGKKIGEKWKFQVEQQGVKLDYACEFQGWAEEKGKRIAVIKVNSPKQKAVRIQPNGVPGVAETESEGMVYFEPSSQESLMRMSTQITAEPTEEEIARLKAKGQTIPRNRSELKHFSRIYRP